MNRNSELLAKGEYKLDSSTLFGELNTNGNAWKVRLQHKLSDEDKLEAELKSDANNVPTLKYTREQDGVLFTLSAPVSSDIRADAKLSIKRTFEL